MLDNSEFDSGDSYSPAWSDIAKPTEPDLTSKQLTLDDVTSGSFGADHAVDLYTAPDLAAKQVQSQFSGSANYDIAGQTGMPTFTQKAAPNAGFPDRIALEGQDVASAADPFAHGMENFWGTLKAIPGIGAVLSPLGDALGSLGRSLEGSAPANAAGAAMDAAGEGFKLALGSPVLGGALQSALTLAAAGTHRVGTVFDQLGTSIDEVGRAQQRLVTGKGSVSDYIGTIFDSAIAYASSPFVGSLWRDSDKNRHGGDSVWGAARTVNIAGTEVPQDLLDSAEIVSAIGAGKAVGLARAALGGNEAGAAVFNAISRVTGRVSKELDRIIPQPIQDFAYGFQRAGRGFDPKAVLDQSAISASQKLGHLSGATVAAMTGIGAAEELVLRTDALKDTDFAKTVMGNRFGPEDAKWRLPYELAATWPLDLFGLAETANKARWAQFARDGLAGPPVPAVQKFYGGVENMQRLVDEGKATWQGFSDQYKYAQMQLARERLADEAMVGYDAKAAGWTDEQLAEPRALERVREEALNSRYASNEDFQAALDQKLVDLGRDRSFDDQVHNMMLRDAESAGLKSTDDNALNWRDYSRNMTDLRDINSDLVLARNDKPTSWDYQQAAATVEKLGDGLGRSQFDALMRDNPAIVKDLRQKGIVTYDDLRIKQEGGFDFHGWLEKRTEALSADELGRRTSAADKLAEPANKDIQAVADRYLKRAALPPAPRFATVEVDQQAASDIADLYRRAKSRPDDPRVRAAYDALNKETEAQWRTVSRNVKVERWTGAGEPYSNTAEMRTDILNNKHLYVAEGPAHPLMTPEQSFRFRAVHDYFGYALNGYDRTARGAENAWLAHSQMYSKQARGAMTTETRARNSFAAAADAAPGKATNEALAAAQGKSFAPDTGAALKLSADGTALAYKQAAEAYADTLKNGGATRSISGDVPTTGFALSPYKGRETILDGTGSVEEYRVFVRKNLDLLSQPDHFIGSWQNDGKTYLDVSVVKSSREEAVLLAQEHEQLAIYDLASGADIPVPQRSKAANGPAATDRGADGANLGVVPKGLPGDAQAVAGKATLLPEKYWSRPDVVNLDQLQARAAELSPMEKVRTQLGKLYADQYKAEAAGDAAGLAKAKASIEAIKQKRLDELAQAHAALDAKELQRFAYAFDNPTGGRSVQALLNAMKGDLQRAHELLSEEEMTLRLLGTRWHLEPPPQGSTILRVTDGIGGKDVSEAQRRALGRAYDAIFGPVTNRELRTQWMDRTYAEGQARGLTTVQMDQWFTKLRQEADNGSAVLGHKVAGSVRSLESSTVNRIGREVFGTDSPRGMKSWAQFLDYHNPGPLPHALEKAGGGEFHYPEWLADKYRDLVKHVYPIFRFYMDPRWRLMNIPEKAIEGAALTGIGSLARKASTDATQLAKLHGVEDAQLLGVPTDSIIGNRLTAERLGALVDGAWADHATNAFMDAVMRDKTMEGLVAHYGGEKAAFRAVSGNLIDIGKTLSAHTGASKEVSALEAEVRELRRKRDVPGIPTDRLLSLDAELAQRTTQLNYASVKLQTLDAVKQAALSDEKLLHPVYSAIAASRLQTLQDLERALEGSPTRSEAQRVLNSYLLYWPLSYQFRVGKDLARILTSQVAGVHSGMAPFTTWAYLRSQHEQRMQNDRQYAAAFKHQDAALQLFEQLLPITPEGLGITLGGPTRIVEHLATGRFDAVRDLERLYHVGPILSSGIADRIVSQEAGAAKSYPNLKLNEATLGQVPQVP